MGAVLHTLNPRLFPEQIEYMTLQAEDQVVIANLSLSHVLAPMLRKLTTVHAVIAVGDGELAPLEESGNNILRYGDVTAIGGNDFDWPNLDEDSAAVICSTSGTTGRPKGVVYSHRSSYLLSMTVCTGNVMGLDFSDRVLPIVPMFHPNAWGFLTRR
jgi:fatty-acyl-CoA synthase